MITSALCYRVCPIGAEYFGYVFAKTRGKARVLAMQSDPGSSPPYLAEDFTHWLVRRWQQLDGRLPTGAALWCPQDVPDGSTIDPVDLWTGI
jgi:hypothetical protein